MRPRNIAKVVRKSIRLQKFSEQKDGLSNTTDIKRPRITDDKDTVLSCRSEANNEDHATDMPAGQHHDGVDDDSSTCEAKKSSRVNRNTKLGKSKQERNMDASRKTREKSRFQEHNDRDRLHELKKSAIPLVEKEISNVNFSTEDSHQNDALSYVRKLRRVKIHPLSQIEARIFM